jgi:hypothetical protein
MDSEGTPRYRAAPWKPHKCSAPEPEKEHIDQFSGIALNHGMHPLPGADTGRGPTEKHLKEDHGWSDEDIALPWRQLNVLHRGTHL